MCQNIRARAKNNPMMGFLVKENVLCLRTKWCVLPPALNLKRRIEKCSGMLVGEDGYIYLGRAKVLVLWEQAHRPVLHLFS